MDFFKEHVPFSHVRLAYHSNAIAEGRLANQNEREPSYVEAMKKNLKKK